MAIPYFLTDKVYTFILSHFDRAGYPPSDAQIMDGCKLSQHYVYKALLFLRGMGKLDGRIPVERVARGSSVVR